MKTSFDLLKNGNNATVVWANVDTKETYPANRNSFGWNALCVRGDAFYAKYGNSMKINQGKGRFSGFSYSAKSMNEIGFTLVMRGDKPLW